jgi:hypothetical protein
MVKVTNMILVFLMFILWSSLVGAQGSATLSWTPPTHNDDGSVLTDLAGFKIYHSTTQGSDYQLMTIISDPNITTYVTEELSIGFHYFVATAFNVDDIESIYSNEAVKEIVPIPTVPNPPTNLVAEGGTAYMLIKITNKLVLAAVGTVPAGVVCDKTQPILGHYVVPWDSVELTGTSASKVLVAACS